MEDILKYPGVKKVFQLRAFFEIFAEWFTAPYREQKLKTTR